MCNKTAFRCKNDVLYMKRDIFLPKFRLKCWFLETRKNRSADVVPTSAIKSEIINVKLPL